MQLHHFVKHYIMPKSDSTHPTRRSKTVVVIVRPYHSPDPDGPDYEQYCRQRIMLHKPFQDQQTLQADFASYAEAYATFLQSGDILQDDIYLLEQQSQQYNNEGDNDHDQPDSNQQQQLPHTATEEWMLLCQSHPYLQTQPHPQQEFDWTASTHTYPNILEAPTFITRSREIAPPQQFTTTADPAMLQGKQLHAYTIIKN